MGQQALRYNDDALSPQIRALLELESFLSNPACVGLDNIKESLRNSIQLMLELKGYSTGYDLSHLPVGEHSSLAMEGSLRDDRIKKKKAQQLLDDLLEIEREMSNSFSHVFESTRIFIHNIETRIDEKIDAIDDQIEDIAQNKEHAEQLKKSSKKRKRLKLFKKHVKEHKEELNEAESTEEIINIQQNLAEDLKDFNAGKDVIPKSSRLSGLSVLSGFSNFIFRRNSNDNDQPDSFYDFARDVEPQGYHDQAPHYQRDDETGDGSGDNGEQKDVDPPYMPDL